MAGYVTMADYSAQLAKQGKTQASGIVNLMRQQNRLFDVLQFKETNTPGGTELVPVEGSLPNVDWRIINKGTTETKGSFKTLSFTCGGLESFCKVDEKLIQVCGAEYGSAQNVAHMTAMANKVASTFFYGNEAATPEGFTGLSTYYDTVDNEQVFSGVGEGPLTSVWFCSFGPHSLYGIHPRGVPTGFQVHQNGIVKEERDGLELHCYEYQYNWDMGLALVDSRACARVANVDITASTENLLAIFHISLASAYAATTGRPGETLVCFANRKALAYILEASCICGFSLTYQDFKGKITPHIFGVPVLVCEALSMNEDRVPSAS